MSLSAEFKECESILIGNPKQFLVYQGEVHCVKDVCDNTCPYYENGCEFEEVKIPVGLIESPRRGIGYEETSFLVLKFKEYYPDDCIIEPPDPIPYTIQDLPKELWDNEYTNLSLYPYNLHWVLTPEKSKFRIIKGQIRYYGSQEEFQRSPYNDYFEVLTQYDPIHKLMSLDFSAIEPRCTTALCQEKAWLDVMEGSDKIVAREVELGEDK